MQRRQNKFFISIFVFFFTIITFASVSLAGDPGIYKEEYKLTVNVASSFYWGMGATKFAELVRERTNGRINVKPYYNSTLLKGAQLESPQMVARGIIDCAFESTINCSKMIPKMNVFSLPFFINSFENLDRLENGETGGIIFAAMEEIGLKPLAWGENGFRQITNSKRAIQRPEDLRGLKIRVVGIPIFDDTFRALGADPVNMDWADAVTAFQQGVVDGQENPVGILIPAHIFQYHKYITFWNYLADPLILYWNKEQWNAFPEEIQNAIMEAAEESSRFEKALARAGLDGLKSLHVLRNAFHYDIEVPDPVKFFEAKGMTVSFLSDDQLKAFKEAVKPVNEKWINEIGRGLYDTAKLDMGQ